MLKADSEKSILMFQNSLRPLLLKNTENMHLSKMVKTAKPISKLLYTDKTRRGKKERKYLPRMLFFCLFVWLLFVCFFATTIKTVFTDEVMQSELRGQQQEG